MRRSILRLAIFACAVISIPGLSDRTYAGQTQLKACKIQSRPLTIKKTSKPLRLVGSVLRGGSMEYKLKSRADMTVEAQLTTADSKLKFDVYSLDPLEAMTKQQTYWSGKWLLDKDYVVAITNCSGKASAKYEFTITTR